MASAKITPPTSSAGVTLKAIKEAFGPAVADDERADKHAHKPSWTD
jgi:hypothetical protein